MCIKKTILGEGYVRLVQSFQFLNKYLLELVLKTLLFNELQIHLLRKKLFFPWVNLDNSQQNFLQIIITKIFITEKYITQFLKNW